MKKIGAINGLRGLAILAVTFGHYWLFYVESKGMEFQWIIRNGWIGVNLFFILSGFVLFLPYQLAKREFVVKSDYINFYRNRIKRLYPLLIVSLLVSALIFKGVSFYSLKNSVLVLSTLSMFSSQTFFPYINPVLWSLVVEVWFSIVFPLIVLAIGRFGIQKVSIIIFALSLTLRFPGAYFDFPSPYLNPLKDNFITRLDDFMLGILICRIVYQSPARRTFFVRTPIVVLGFILLIFGMFAWDLRFLGKLPIVLVPFLNNIFQIAFLIIIIAGLEEGSSLNKFLSSWGLQIAGLMCYSIYLWHLLFIPLFLKQPPVLWVFGYVIVVTIFSALTYRYVEFYKEKSVEKLFLLNKTA